MKRENLNNPQYQDNMYSIKRETYKKNIKLYIVKAFRTKNVHKTSFEA